MAEEHCLCSYIVLFVLSFHFSGLSRPFLKTFLKDFSEIINMD